MWVKLSFITFLTAILATATIAEDSAERSIVERAANCWTTPEAMRGMRFAATVDVNVSDSGAVELVAIRDVLPQTDTARALASDFAAALERCGPYGVKEGGAMTLPLSWPL